MTDKYFWIAINGASVAAQPMAIEGTPYVWPTPEQLIGYRTFEEQHKVQQFLLTAPIEEVGNLGDAFCARSMLIARHAYRRAKTLGGIRDAFIVRSDDDFAAGAFAAAAIHMLDHGPAIDLTQWLSG